jgi:glycosyltransferase involved in cell wall biosynthesis
MQRGKEQLDLFYHDDEDQGATFKFVKELAKQLSRYFDVKLFLYSDEKKLKVEERDGFALYRVPRLRFPFLSSLAKSGTLQKVYHAVVAYSPSMYLLSTKVSSAQYCLCVDSYTGLIVGSLAKFQRKKVIFRPNDCLISFGSQVYSLQSKVLGAMIVVYALAVESTISRIADLFLVPSRKTMQLFKKYYGTSDKFMLCHYGITRPQPELTPGSQVAFRSELDIPPDEKVLIFLGVGDWLPNQLAIEYIINELGPYLERRASRSLILIVGKRTEKYRASVKSKNVRVVGEVPDVMPYILASDLGLAPLSAMGGNSSKVIDYLYYGLPTLATPEAAETVEPQTGLFVAEKSGFSDAVYDLLASDRPENRKAIGEEAFSHYSFEKIVARVADGLKSLSDGSITSKGLLLE